MLVGLIDVHATVPAKKFVKKFPVLIVLRDVKVFVDVEDNQV